MTFSTRYSTSRPTLLAAICLLALSSFAVFNISCFNFHLPDLAWLDYHHEPEFSTKATRDPKIIFSEATDLPTNVHTFHDGEVTIGTDAPRHPVLDILEHANEKWESLLDAHDGDVSDIHMVFSSYDSLLTPTQQTRALRQYRLRRPGKNRPAFRAFSSISPIDLFSPVSSSLLVPRQQEAEILSDTFTLIIRSGVPSVKFGNLTASVPEKYRKRRVVLLLEAIRPFVNSLPDLRATFNVRHHPRHALPSHGVEVLTALATDHSLPNSPIKLRSQTQSTSANIDQGRPIHVDDLNFLESTMTRLERWSWENACYAQLDIEEQDERRDFTPAIRFVASPQARGDPCLHRALAEVHPSYESTPDLTYHTRISPIISETTASWASDVLLPPLDFFASDLHIDALPAIPWNNRTAGLSWRGPAAEYPASYSIMQLQRLLDLIQDSKEYNIILPTDSAGFLIDHRQLRDVLAFDVQQGNDDPEMEAGRKFLIELDGGAQMRAQMASGGLVFHPLLLGDWVSEHSVPWVHYVPVQPDLSDLPSLMAFFERYDALAQRIAYAGQVWARQQLHQTRARDQIRRILEGWARLGSGLREL